MEIASHSPEETMRIAEAVGELLRPGDLLNLNGELGAGKTLFVKGLAAALGIPAEMVTSPTFSIINEYMGKGGLLYHFDFYRLQDELELENIGYQDYFYGSGITVVEWGDLFREQLPEERLDIVLEKAGSQGRKLTFSGCGDRGREIAEQVRRRLGVHPRH
ncbi:tRNA (adenosine(37)-N6)-threonylcarbamoyltransferase complex ATPase subunit type 1 TsaE [Candidatus Darwinibacter acetoxidans]|nr:tRNA (adenosine(37)-N6)-threonylcarbamoyltransferase complex ATPase subunit type 1 TsaE [Bacillota bacterium]